MPPASSAARPMPLLRKQPSGAWIGLSVTSTSDGAGVHGTPATTTPTTSGLAVAPCQEGRSNATLGFTSTTSPAVTKRAMPPSSSIAARASAPGSVPRAMTIAGPSVPEAKERSATCSTGWGQPGRRRSHAAAPTTPAARAPVAAARFSISRREIGGRSLIARSPGAARRRASTSAAR